MTRRYGEADASPGAAAALILVLAAAASAAPNLPPRRRTPLLAWLRAASYRVDYTPEPTAHESAGPHGAGVRTWYDPVLVEDLRAGRTTFRKGAAMVKELHGGNGELAGWAVMRKVRPRSGTGGGWLFFETFDPTGRGATLGRGNPTCTGCHRLGTDYLRSTFRP